MVKARPDEPLVSVIIPTRNRPHYLREAIASALGQTYSNIEVLVRDNASDQGTHEVVSEFKDKRLHYLRHPFDVGPTRNVIEGCRDARGTFLANLHDDDVWEPEFLARLLPPLVADPSLAIAFCDHHIIDADGEIDPVMTRRNTRHWKRDRLVAGRHQPMFRLAVVDKSIPLSMAAVMRKAAIDWNDVPDLPSGYDTWLMYLFCRDGQAGYYLPERLTRYRVHGRSETALGRMRVDQGFLICCERMLSDVRLRSVWPELKREFSRASTDLGITLTRDGRVAEGRPHLKRALQVRCTLRALALYAVSFSPTFRLRAGGQHLGRPVLAVNGTRKPPVAVRGDS